MRKEHFISVKQYKNVFIGCKDLQDRTKDCNNKIYKVGNNNRNNLLKILRQKRTQIDKIHMKVILQSKITRKMLLKKNCKVIKTCKIIII